MMFTSKGTAIFSSLKPAGLSLWIVVCALQSCTLPEPEKGREGTQAATFTVDSLEGHFISEEIQKNFGYPTQRTYSITACLKDIAYARPLTNQDFLLDEKEQTLKTNAQGCLNWTEKIEMNFLADPSHLKLTRTLSSQGLHRGQRSVEFAINPWAEKEDSSAVVDLNKSKVESFLAGPEAELRLSGFNSERSAFQKQLWVEDGRLSVVDDKTANGKFNIAYDLRVTPSLLLRKLNRESFSYDLHSGVFNAEVEMIHRVSLDGNASSHHSEVLGNFKKEKLSINSGYLSIPIKFELNKIPSLGNIFLKLKLSYAEANRFHVPFEGYFLIGNYRSIRSGGFLRVLDKEAAAKEKFNSTSNSVTQSKDFYIQPKIEVLSLNIGQPRIKSEINFEKDVIYTVTACLRHGIDQDMIRGQKFQVTKFRQKESDPAENLNREINNATSCFSWDEVIRVKTFECRKFLKGFIVIENKNLGMSEKLSYYINPWEIFGLFARDARDVADPQKFETTCNTNDPQKGLQSQIHIDSYSFKTLQNNYEVDGQLNLTLKKNFLLTLNPQALVYSDLLGARRESQKLVDGFYLLKVMILKNPEVFGASHLVAATEKLVSVIKGQINANLSLTTSDLKTLGVRNRMALQLFPVHEDQVQMGADGNLRPLKPEATLNSLIVKDSGLRSQTFVGPVILNSDSDSSPMVLFDPTEISQYLQMNTSGTESKNLSYDEILRKGQEIRAQVVAQKALYRNPKFFAQADNLRLLKWNNSGEGTAVTLPASSVQFLFEKSELNADLARRLCETWAETVLKQELGIPSISFTQLCREGIAKSPRNFFQWSQNYLIHSLSQQKMIQNGIERHISLGNDFSMSSTLDKSRYQATEGGLGVPKIFSTGVDVGYQVGMSKSLGQHESNAISLNQGTSLTVNEAQFEIITNKYQKCMSVRLEPRLFTKSSSLWDFFKSDLRRIFRANLKSEQMLAAARRGILLCGELNSKTPMSLKESFYLVSQNIHGNEIQDALDERNKSFFVVLRGRDDFNRVARMMTTKFNFPEGPQAHEFTSEVYFQHFTELFEFSAAQPGVYTYSH